MTESRVGPPTLVTVAIPVFNGEPYVEAALQSVIEQSYQHLEIIVVDDGSTDRSCEIISSFKDPRVRLLRLEKNQGIESAWNRCLSEAAGRYMTLLPQDDLLMPCAIEERMAIFHKAPGTVLVFNSRRIINERGGLITNRRAPFFGGVVSARKLVASCVISGLNHVGDPAAVTFSVSDARQLHEGFSGRWPWVIDLEFWTRLMQSGEVYYLRKSLSAFRVNRRALSVRLRLQQAQQFEAFSRFARDLYGFPRWYLVIGRLASAISQGLRNQLYRFG